MRAAHLCLQQPKADDYLIATGQTSSLEDFLRLSFNCVGLDYRDHVVSSSELLRPLDIQETRCDVSETNSILDWQAKADLSQIVQDMINHELKQQGGQDQVRERGELRLIK